VLSPEDKANIKAVWAKVCDHAPDYVTEALERQGPSSPRSHFGTNTHSRAPLVADTLTSAMAHLDDMPSDLSELRQLHVNDLWVDPGNIRVSFGPGGISGVGAAGLPHKTQQPMLYPCGASMDKFFAFVSAVLTSKYH
uniref:Globin domain-containing protein n=1 Tax=Piliocolobus tephrosceles TaxID=591936 RepID=A0A8C9GIA2_9PRIM